MFLSVKPELFENVNIFLHKVPYFGLIVFSSGETFSIPCYLVSWRGLNIIVIFIFYYIRLFAIIAEVAVLSREHHSSFLLT